MNGTVHRKFTEITRLRGGRRPKAPERWLRCPHGPVRSPVRGSGPLNPAGGDADPLVMVAAPALGTDEVSRWLSAYPHVAGCAECRCYALEHWPDHSPEEVVVAALALHDSGHRHDPFLTAESFALAE